MPATFRHLVCISLAVLTHGVLAAPEQPRPVAAPLPDLETAYLECDRASRIAVLAVAAAARCAAIADALLARSFDGDLERMNAWLRTEKARVEARSR